jgi:EAL domain-containing protein (putative c-di-GMP-specific phosphodiesterase class I)
MQRDEANPEPISLAAIGIGDKLALDLARQGVLIRPLRAGDAITPVLVGPDIEPARARTVLAAVLCGGNPPPIFALARDDEAMEAMSDAGITAFVALTGAIAVLASSLRALVEREHRVGPTVSVQEKSALRELEQALRQRQLEVFYQPKASAVTRALCGAEALLRWRHPTRGMVSPTEFIPLAERHGLIEELGMWALEEACRQTVRWIARGLDPGVVSINLSPHQLERPGIARLLLDRIAATELPTKRVQLELTEGFLLDHDRACSVLRELREGGVRIAIDDFGTGYSSLQYLRDLPIDTVKIDRVFVSRLDDDDATRGLVVAIISLAWSLGMRVVAEGVETEAQWEFLVDHGCEEIQGFLFGRPMEAQAFGKLLVSTVEAPRP